MDSVAWYWLADMLILLDIRRIIWEQAQHFSSNSGPRDPVQEQVAVRVGGSKHDGILREMSRADDVYLGEPAGYCPLSSALQVLKRRDEAGWSPRNPRTVGVVLCQVI